MIMVRMLHSLIVSRMSYPINVLPSINRRIVASTENSSCPPESSFSSKPKCPLLKVTKVRGATIVEILVLPLYPIIVTPTKCYWFVNSFLQLWTAM